MKPNTTMRWWLAAGAAAALGTAGVARAGSPPHSGGPGALGTEVPFDSRLAREYFNYYLPNDTPEAIRIRDAVQRLHADHQAIAALAQAGATAQDPAVGALARRLGDEQAIIDGSLVDVARDSLLPLSGAANDQQAQADAAAVHEVQGAAGPERDARLLAAVTKLLEGQRANVEQLLPEAKKAHRQQLGSVLDRERKLLGKELDAVRRLASKVAVRGEG